MSAISNASSPTRVSDDLPAGPPNLPCPDASKIRGSTCLQHIFAHLPFLTHRTIKTILDQRARNYFEISAKDLQSQKTHKNIGNTIIRGLYTLSLIIIAITLPVFLLADLLYSHFRVTPLPDCHYQFESPVFSSYFEQMQGFVNQAVNSQPTLVEKSEPKSPFEKEVMAFIEFIRTTKLSTPNSKLEFHQQVIDRLRTLLNKKEIQPNASSQFLQDFSRWLYTGPQVQKAMNEFFQSQVLSPAARLKLSSLNHSNLCEFLKKSHEAIDQNKKKFPGLCGSPPYYDAHRLGDLPSSLFEVSHDGKKTKFIRTPAVTMDIRRDALTLLEASVVPEFLGLLDENEPHLYVNLMERSSGSEQIRSSVIEKLQNEYPEKKFHFITLDKDSHFYKQSKAPKSVTAVAFKETFFESLFSSSAFYWPSSLMKGDWKDKCRQIIEDTHTKFFSGKMDLSTSDRQEFIEIAYYAFISEAVKILKPSTCNISCRSSIDRAATMIGGVYANYLFEKQHNLTQENCLEIATLVLTPAVLAQNRAPFKNRVDRLLPALHRMLTTTVPPLNKKESS